MILRGLTIFTVVAVATSASADEPRELCADRPGLNTPACTLDGGRVMAEVGIAAWSRDRDLPSRASSLTAGDFLIKVGLTGKLQAHIGWTAYGRVWDRDLASGERSSMSGAGDVTLALRQNLRNPDGSGFSVAVMPHATLPAGREPIGARDWSAGIGVPMTLDLGGFSLAFTPSVDAAVDGDGKGRHLGFGIAAGLGFSLSDHVSVSDEISIYRDQDPAGRATQILMGVSLAWQLVDDAQLDVGATFGLDGASPDTELYLGYARRF